MQDLERRLKKKTKFTVNPALSFDYHSHFIEFF